MAKKKTKKKTNKKAKKRASNMDLAVVAIIILSIWKFRNSRSKIK